MAFNFLKSSHKLLSIKLALKFRVTPDHVYDLAHGRMDVDTHTDHLIVRYFRDHKCFADVKKKHRHSHRPQNPST